MKLKAFSILFLLILFGSIGYSQNLIEYSGRVVNQKFEPLEGALVRIFGSHLATVTQADGTFFLPLHKEDTLLISYIGYLPEILYITPSDSTQAPAALITLKSTSYELDAVNILPWPETYAELKRAIIQLNIKDEKMALLNIPGIPRNIPQLSDGTYGVTAMGPVQLLYNAFSKRAKQARNYRKKVKIEKRFDLIYLKYNRELVARITGLKDPIETDTFMKYCGLSDEFVLSAKDYDIYLAILECWRNYKQNKEG